MSYIFSLESHFRSSSGTRYFSLVLEYCFFCGGVAWYFFCDLNPLLSSCKAWNGSRHLLQEPNFFFPIFWPDFLSVFSFFFFGLKYFLPAAKLGTGAGIFCRSQSTRASMRALRGEEGGKTLKQILKF